MGPSRSGHARRDRCGGSAGLSGVKASGDIAEAEFQRVKEKLPRQTRTVERWGKDMDGIQILPLAVTMMIGPQIMSAIIFVTTPKAVRVSLVFLAGVAAATAVEVAVMMGLAALLGGAVDMGSAQDNSSTGQIIQYVLVGTTRPT